MAEMVRPSGHLQVVDRGRGPRWHALWRDADGRHQRSLGPAWVKNSGKRTPRGAIVWHTANGPKPDLSYLTPADAADELRRILAGAPRASATRGPRAGLALESVAWEWLEHGERKRGLKHPLSFFFFTTAPQSTSLHHLASCAGPWPRPSPSWGLGGVRARHRPQTPITTKVACGFDLHSAIHTSVRARARRFLFTWGTKFASDRGASGALRWARTRHGRSDWSHGWPLRRVGE